MQCCCSFSATPCASCFTTQNCSLYSCAALSSVTWSVLCFILHWDEINCSDSVVVFVAQPFPGVPTSLPDAAPCFWTRLQKNPLNFTELGFFSLPYILYCLPVDQIVYSVSILCLLPCLKCSVTPEYKVSSAVVLWFMSVSFFATFSIQLELLLILCGDEPGKAEVEEVGTFIFLPEVMSSPYPCWWAKA